MSQRTSRSLFTRFATAFCAVMMFLSLAIAPSFAAGLFGNNSSEPATPGIMKDAEDIANPDKQPMSLEEIQERTNGGLNEIQGTTDADKMINDTKPGEPDSAVAQKLNKEMKKRSN